MDKEFTCPHCKQEVDLSKSYPEDAGLDSDSYFYKWQCPNCKESFTQWYDLVWSENL